MVCCKKTQLRSERGQEKKDHWPSSNSGPTLLRTCTAVQFTLRYCTFNTLEWAWEEWHLRLPCKMRTCLLCAGIVHKFSNTWLADLLHKALFVYRRTILHVQGYAKTCGHGHVLTAGQLHMWWVILVTTPARNGWIRTFQPNPGLTPVKEWTTLRSRVALYLHNGEKKRISLWWEKIMVKTAERCGVRW